MRTFRRVLILILAIVLVVVLIGFILPKKVCVERSLLIKAPREAIFVQVNTLKNWELWSPWHRIDTAMKIRYSGPESGNGAAYDWQSENHKVGSGRIEILTCFPFDSILLLMDFGKDGKASSKFVFSDADTAVMVTWKMESDIGNNPVSRWFGLFMDWMVGSDFEEGLKNISLAVAETTANEIKVVETEVPERMIISIRDTASLATFGPKFGTMFGKISGFMKLINISPTGPPLAFYHNYTPASFDLEVAIQVAKILPDKGEIHFSTLAPANVAKVEYFGAYDAIAPVYDALQKYIAGKGLSVSGSPWEEYITDPFSEPDTAKWQTNVYFPVK